MPVIVSHISPSFVDSISAWHPPCFHDPSNYDRYRTYRPLLDLHSVDQFPPPPVDVLDVGLQTLAPVLIVTSSSSLDPTPASNPIMLYYIESGAHAN
jgi:hypothetical protein